MVVADDLSGLYVDDAGDIILIHNARLFDANDHFKRALDPGETAVRPWILYDCICEGCFMTGQLPLFRFKQHYMRIS